MIGLAALAGGLVPGGAARAAPAVPEHARAVAPDGRGALGLFVRGARKLVPGTRARLRVEAHLATGPAEVRPAAGVEVEVRLVAPPVPPDGGRRKARPARPGGPTGVVLFSGRSDDRGHVEASFEVPSSPAGGYRLELWAQLGSRRATERFDVELVPGGRVLVQSDKPLYQPGQAVRLRTVVLRPLDGRPLGGDGTAAGAAVVFEVRDPRDNRVFQERRPLSRFGVAAVDFPLARDVLLGRYTVLARVSPSPSAVESESPAPPGELSIEVARYRLPRFQVELTTDRQDYRPGQVLEARIAARYHFGKPVAGGRLTLETRVDYGASPGPLVGVLGADGKGRFKVQLPAGALPGKIRLRAAVEEAGGAGSRQEAQAVVELAKSPLLVEVVSEAGQLIPGLANRLHVVATYRDGKPAVGARVHLEMAGTGPGQAVTDAQGVAELLRVPAPAAPGRGGCAYGHQPVKVQVRDGAGFTALAERCLRRAPRGTPLLRTARVLHRGDEPIAATVELPAGVAPGAGGAVHVDLVKDGQIIETASVPMQAGPTVRGEVMLPASADRFGSLVVRAYVVHPDGTRHHDARLVLVERAGALQVSARAMPAGGAAGGTGATLRPGQATRLHFQVKDSATGAGVKAQLGIRMVDEALLALRQVRQRSAGLFFHLSREAAGAGQKLAARPAGLTVEQVVVARKDDPARRQRAARVLLAGVLVNAAADAWESEPWQVRREQHEAQKRRLGDALEKHLRTHVVGERRDGRWDYQQDLLDRMVRAGSLAAGDRLDPWGRPVTRQQLLAGQPSFDSVAESELERRLTVIYRALRARRGRLAGDGRPGRVTLAAADLDQLVADRRLRAGERLDPWGTPFRVMEQRSTLDVIGVRSRFLVASAGPDQRPGTADDLYAMDVSCGNHWRVAGRPWKEATQERVWGCGYGRGSGPGGGGVGLGSIGLGRIGTIGRGGGAGAAPVRQRFPETLLWRPDLVTDDRGEATVDLAMADSITTWQLFAEAVSLDGRLGETSARVRVFQEFFAEVDLPPVATQHDELEVPVAVYNYLDVPQRVTLELEAPAAAGAGGPAPWFVPLGERTQVVTLGPSEVGVRHFRVRLLGLGTRALTVHARDQSVADAVRRTIEVHPDGREHRLAFQSLLRAGPEGALHTVEVPSTAIAGTELAQLKLYPRSTTHVLEGLDSLLRMPSGCFEQTSSTTYPNALILDYLRQRRQATPELTRKAMTYLQAGYQRLLKFEVPGGGFSWFGEAPANSVLTAYGVLEFHDMARVFPVDPQVIRRTQRWLMGRQAADGSFPPDRGGIAEGVTNGLTSDRLRITAYIGGVLAQTASSASSPAAVRAAARRAAAYVEQALAAPGSAGRSDAYGLALAAQLFGATGYAAREQSALAHLQALARQTPDGGRRWFEAQGRTPTHGRGASGNIETTALAVQALLGPGGRRRPLGSTLDPLLAFLVGSKDALGNWHSTQATIQSLRALLAVDRSRPVNRGRVIVEVDGAEVARVAVDAASNLLTTVDLAGAARPGSHRVAVRFAGEGEVAYQLVTGHHRPWEPGAAASVRTAAGGLEVSTRVMGTAATRVGQELRAEVELTSRLDEPMDMPLIQAGLPPGFDLDVEALDDLVRQGRVAKVERGAREVTFYLKHLPARSTVKLPLRLRARLPVRAQMPAPLAFEYYRPEQRALGRPLVVMSSR